MVIWLTGLSGAGKTTIARHLLALWRDEAPASVLVDGDAVRRILGAEGGEDAYTLAGRRAVADRIAAICAWLDEQGVNVVCSTISLFGDLHERNARTFSRYFEVFIDVPMAVLRRRDDKNIYARAERGELKNVMGVDLPFQPPRSPHLVIDNGTDGADLRALAATILDKARGGSRQH